MAETHEQLSSGASSHDAIATEAVRRAIKPLAANTAVTDMIVPTPSAFGRLICKRRSHRALTSTSITQEQLERLMVDCAGGVLQTPFLTTHGEIDFLYRTIPQSGGICSVGAHLILLRPTAKMSSGLYSLCPHANTLHHVGKVPNQATILQAMGLLGEKALDEAAAIIVISADLEAKAFKYGTRGHRYAVIEVGCALQNVLSSACDQGIGAYAFGGFDDDAMVEMFSPALNDAAPFITAVVGGIPKSEDGDHDGGNYTI